MPTYQQLQENLFNELEAGFRKGQASSTIVSSIEDFSRDQRMCLTGVSFLSKELQEEIHSHLITPLKEADPRQYYYLPQSLHLTIKNVRVISDPPTFGEKEIKLATKAFQSVIPKHSRFNYELRGLFELPTSLAIRAYSDSKLKDLALELSEALEQVGVPDDKQYASRTVFFGNTTVVRYSCPPNDAFFAKVAELKNEAVGTFTLDRVSLITTNTVAHPDHTNIIQELILSS